MDNLLDQSPDGSLSSMTAVPQQELPQPRKETFTSEGVYLHEFH